MAIIAGAGRFPFHVAQEAKRQGWRVCAVGLRGWADAALRTHVDAYAELGVGELRRLIDWCKGQAVQQAVMAGKVTKDVLLTQLPTFDAEMLTLLGRVTDASVNSLLGAVAERLGREGITLLDSSTFLTSSLCPVGVLTARAPSDAETEDIRIGRAAARAIAGFDIGQTVVVKQRVIVAVEALEGTDAAIRRARALAGAGLVVVKTGAPAQDRRFDLPVVGTETIATLRDCGVVCLAVEAGTTLLLERDALIAAANAAKICLTGIE